MRIPLASCCLISAAMGAGEAFARDDVAADPAVDRLSDARPVPAPGEPMLSLVQVEINGHLQEDPVFIATIGAELLLPADLLSDQRIKGAGASVMIDKRAFLTAASAGLDSVDYDTATETLRIACSAECFNPSLVSASEYTPAKLSPVTPGAFVNYDFFAQGGDIDTRTGALFEAGIFTAAGTGVSKLACSDGGLQDGCVRLDTTWTIDNPQTARRLTLGDAVTGAAGWGAPARFGGIRWGTDFSLTPDLVTFPTPSLSGDAALPGVVDVIVNDAQRFSSDVPAGPFTVADLPVVTGAGTAQLVMTDVLGRETVVTTDYYAAPQLLRPGLKQWSLEAGFLREDYGFEADHYDDAFLAGSYARGLSDAITLGVRSEISAGFQSAGMSSAFLAPEFGVFQASAAMSNSDAGTGGLIDLRHEWRSSEFSLGSSVAYATDQYRQFGRARNLPRLTARTFASYTNDELGSLSLSWTHSDERALQDFTTFGLRYTRSVGPVSFNLSAVRLQGIENTTVAALSFSMPLGGGASGGGSIDYRRERLSGDLRYRRNAPVAGGIGYYARAAIDGDSRYEAGTDIRTRYGDASAAFSNIENRNAVRLSARGGAALIGDQVIVTPTITDSIAIVSVGEEPGVRIFQDRQLIGVTDKHGRAVLTRLRPFERNLISFDPRDLSLASAFDVTEMILVPGLRTGHVVAFESSRKQNAMAYIVDAQGRPVADQGGIANARTGEVYPIGQGGRVYIDGAEPVTRLKFVRDRVICEAEVRLDFVPPNAPYEDVGEVECLPVASLR